MGDGMVRRLAIAQRKRAVATVLGTVEREWLASGKVTRPEYEAFRKVALQAIDVYHDFMLDVLKISDEDITRNDHALELLERIHAGQRKFDDAVRSLTEK